MQLDSYHFHVWRSKIQLFCMNILHFRGDAVINEYHTPILAQHKSLFHIYIMFNCVALCHFKVASVYLTLSLRNKSLLTRVCFKETICSLRGNALCWCYWWGFQRERNLTGLFDAAKALLSLYQGLYTSDGVWRSLRFYSYNMIFWDFILIMCLSPFLLKYNYGTLWLILRVNVPHVIFLFPKCEHNEIWDNKIYSRHVNAFCSSIKGSSAKGGKRHCRV